MALTRFQDSEQIIKDVDSLVEDIERLRLTYEQYFLGLEKREPVQKREKVANLIRKYSGMPIQNTRAKFRYQQIVARYNSFQVYWDRILRQIEEGRYERDVFRAKLHEKERDKAEEEVSKVKSKPKTIKPSGDPMKALFEKYIEAKRKCNQDVTKLTLGGFKKSVKTQMDTIKKKTGAKGVRFQISTSGGQVTLKAIPKKS